MDINFNIISTVFGFKYDKTNCNGTDENGCPNTEVAKLAKMAHQFFACF